MDISAFQATNGFFRTDLRADAMDLDPHSGLLYTVSVVRGATRLTVVDPIALTIVDERVLVDDTVEGFCGARSRTHRDVDVSRDGSTVAVIAGDRLIRLRRTDLEVLSDVQLPSPLLVGWVEAAPDGSDRSIVWGCSGVILLMDGSKPVDLTRFDRRLAFSFGADADTVFGFVDQSVLVEYTVGTHVVESRRMDLGEPTGSFTVANGHLFAFPLRVDPDTLEVTGRLVAPEGRLEQAVDDDLLVVSQFNQWQVFDTETLAPDSPKWSLPSNVRTFDGMPLADGSVAFIEGTERTYLSIAVPRIIATALGDFHPVEPTRVVDTRIGLGPRSGPLTEAMSMTVDMASALQLAADDVLAVAMNITVTEPTAPSFVAVWPSDEARPEVSNVNFGPGQTLANFATVGLSTDGSVVVFNRWGETHVIIDVVGYYATEMGEPGARFDARAGVRLEDTRLDDSGRRRPGRRLQSGDVLRVDVSSLERYSGVGAPRVMAVVANITAVMPDTAGFLTVWSGEGSPPTASTVNFGPGDVRANLTVVRPGVDGTFSVRNAHGSVDVLVDIVGVYTSILEPIRARRPGGKLVAVVPERSFDSRLGMADRPAGPMPADSELFVGLATGWSAVVNVAAVSPTTPGFLSASAQFPFDSTDISGRPRTSTVNFLGGETVANAAYVSTSQDHFSIYNRAGNTDVVVDMFALFAPTHIPAIEEVWPEG